MVGQLFTYCKDFEWHQLKKCEIKKNETDRN